MADPNKWLGLLKWSSKYSDGTNAAPEGPMSIEKRQFLEKVLDEAVMDENERLRQILRILNGEDPQDVYAKSDTTDERYELTEEDLEVYKESLLDELLTRIDQIDMAQNFMKMGALDTLINIATSSANAAFRASALEVIAVMVQNNVVCQNAALNAGVLEFLCDFLRTESEVPCQAKAFLALSSLTRNFKAAEMRFLTSDKCDGLNLIMQYLQSANLGLKTKALLFAQYIIRQSSESAQDLFQSIAFWKTVSNFVLEDDITLCEGSLEILIENVSMYENHRLQDKDSGLDLAQILYVKLQTLNKLPESEEEYVCEVRNKAMELCRLLASPVASA